MLYPPGELIIKTAGPSRTCNVQSICFHFWALRAGGSTAVMALA